MCIAASPVRRTFGLRDYGTGTWEGGNPKCDHVAFKIDANHVAFRKSTLGVGNYKQPAKNTAFRSKTKLYRGECKKCGAKRLDKQLGNEDTPEEYVANMVNVFREVRRVLRDDGTFWLNIGDSYCSNPATRASPNRDDEMTTRNTPTLNKTYQRRVTASGDLKAGDLIGIPWMLAFALRADGWYLRGDNIWHKPNPMPESCSNRCSKNHEYLFLLTKSRRYYFDNIAIMVKAKDWSKGGPGTGIKKTAHYSPNNGGNEGLSRLASKYKKGEQPDTANKRTVWTVATKAFKGAHFAVMPDLLVKPCILAGTSEKGCCAKCGAPYRRVVKKIRNATRPGTNTKVTDTDDKTHGNRDPRRHVTKVITKGWKPTCECGIKETKPCVCLDPFSGAGTVAKVAVSKGRNFVGIELNPKYAEMSRKRISKAILNRGFAL